MDSNDLRHKLQGKWILMHTEHEHYLIFKNGIYQSRHRRGTFSIRKNDSGEFVLEMSDAHHPRVIHMIDDNTMMMTFTVHGSLVKNVYKRDLRLSGRLQMLSVR